MEHRMGTQLTWLTAQEIGAMSRCMHWDMTPYTLGGKPYQLSHVLDVTTT